MEMLRIEDMPADEMHALLQEVGFGHLGCTRDNHPYVVPMHYAFDGHELYFFTTEGTKTEFIAANNEICFQVEDIKDESHWRSVMLIGEARKVTQADEMERAMQVVTEGNPKLTPALNKTDIGAWHRLNNIAIYRVRPNAIYGRKTV
jgi:nitroimidazol reductase NimA-like FMN-containing flavoprotein (pyridoxamine 5'-phosphate oxidase superfamily)